MDSGFVPHFDRADAKSCVHELMLKWDTAGQDNFS